MTQNELMAEMRLYAVEVLVVNLLSIQMLATGKPKELMAKMRQQTIERARHRTFPELGDAAMSDAASAYLELAIRRLMEMGNAQIDRVLQTVAGTSSGT